jgi:hypothetical protein
MITNSNHAYLVKKLVVDFRKNSSINFSVPNQGGDWEKFGMGECLLFDVDFIVII